MKTYNLKDELSFGKFKGYTLEMLIRGEWSYINWCIGNIKWFQLSKEAEDLFYKIKHKEDERRSKQRFKRRNSYGNHGKLSASQQGMIDCFGHTGPDGGWGNGI